LKPSPPDQSEVSTDRIGESPSFMQEGP
jgi:hypothetical protein